MRLLQMLPSILSVFTGPLSRVGRFSFLLALAAIFSAGCRPVMEVSGTVQVDGKPSGGIVVMFDPVEPDLPRGVATTDNDGGYVVRRLGPGNKTGIKTGKYAVKLMADVDDPAAAKIPPKYFRGTELSYEVVSGKENVYDIEVSTK
ncbi:MAG: hypothetical protein RLZZ440_865 [Planctomycetota bacterium]